MAKLDEVTRSRQAKDPVLREYDRLAARYDRRWSFYVDATIREMLRRLAPRPGDKVLDVGCGTGALLQALSLSFPGVVLAGVDLSSEMLGVARSKIASSVKLRQGRAESLPFESKAFDIVVSTSILHYLRVPDDALREMKRVLKPGGQVIVSDWCDDYLACRLCDRFLRLFNRAHFKTYDSAECVELMKAAGFESIDVERFKISWLWGLMTASGTKPV